jgi:TonB family protein
MDRTNMTTTLTVTAVILGMVAPVIGEQEMRTRRFKANDKQFREFAITSPTPAYPPASLARKVSGVVVAAIRTTPTGATEAVAILQSPDAETGRAVRDALLQWTFKPQLGIGGEGRVVFYFHLAGGKGVVLSPAEMREVTSPGAKNVKREDEPPAKHITEEDFRALSTNPSTLLLDIRDRETFGEGREKGAVNIPFDELLTRGPAEIPVSRHVVIDCRDPLDYCAMAVHWLASAGVSQLSILRR